MALEWAQDRQEGVFLFSDTDAVPFYEKCGFQHLEEYLELTDVDGVVRRAGAVKLDCRRRDDRDRIYEYAKRRAPISDKFSVLNAKLVMFHALYTLCDHAYEIPDLECVVFFARDGGCLRVFDLLGERVPALDEFYPYIADEQDRLVEIHFHSDKLGLEAIRTRPLLGNHCFARGLFPVQSPVFPFTSRA